MTVVWFFVKKFLGEKRKHEMVCCHLCDSQFLLSPKLGAKSSHIFTQSL
jgi:hypothetical protein